MWREKKSKNFSLLSLVSWFSFLGGECCVKDATINMDIVVVSLFLLIKKKKSFNSKKNLFLHSEVLKKLFNFFLNLHI